MFLNYKVYMKLIGGMLWIDFDLDCAKNKNKISANKKSKLKKVYLIFQ